MRRRQASHPKLRQELRDGVNDDGACTLSMDPHCRVHRHRGLGVWPEAQSPLQEGRQYLVRRREGLKGQAPRSSDGSACGRVAAGISRACSITGLAASTRSGSRRRRECSPSSSTARNAVRRPGSTPRSRHRRQESATTRCTTFSGARSSDKSRSQAAIIDFSSRVANGLPEIYPPRGSVLAEIKTVKQSS